MIEGGKDTRPYIHYAYAADNGTHYSQLSYNVRNIIFRKCSEYYPFLLMPDNGQPETY